MSCLDNELGSRKREILGNISPNLTHHFNIFMGKILSINEDGNHVS